MLSQSWSATREAFRQATIWFTQTADAVDGRWEHRGLGDWTVRDLAGHTSRALLTIEHYLDQPVAAAVLDSPVDYIVAALASVGDPAAVAQRGREAGAALGADPADALAEIADPVLATVTDAVPDALVATPVGGVHLAEYLTTRTFERTVHTCDLATALGQTLTMPEAAAAMSPALAGALAARTGRAGPLLLAATGRIGLNPGYTVL